MEKYKGKIACYLCKYLVKKEGGFSCTKKVYKHLTVKPSVKERNCNAFKFEY